MPAVKKDIRDSQKVATLPDDLRNIANEMLEKKFGLASQGEVIEKPKKAKKSATTSGVQTTTSGTASPSKKMFTYGFTPDFSDEAAPYDPSDELMTKVIELSSDDLSRASQMLRRGMVSTSDGIPLERWVSYYRSNPERLRGYRYIELLTCGLHTGNRYAKAIDPFQIERMDEREVLYMLRHMLESMQREYLEPLIVLDPRKYY